MSISSKYGNRLPGFRHIKRKWPDHVLERSPLLFSTDLRDGSQALRDPMTFDQKLRMWHLLVSMGFKEIEVGLPCANQSEFDFIRHLVTTDGLIPDDVTIQVITTCREDAVERAVDSVAGAKRAIIFTYLPGSDNYRETVLGISEYEWLARARRVAAFARQITRDRPSNQVTRWIFNFGFEDFANARVETVARCAEAVKAAWGPTEDQKMIFGIASSVESSMPNVFADQVERFCQLVPDRATWRLTVHTHNDRGGAIASAELASLAGADRVEGCLFGNGERAGNMDLVIFGLNRLSEGLDCGIDWSLMQRAQETYADIVKIPIHPRTPYSGAYYFRAFSGMHQDAIIKGLERRAAAQRQGLPNAHWPKWRVPYLPMDPADIGHELESVIEINSQSGKAGVKWILETWLGLSISKEDAANTAQKAKELSIRLARGLKRDEVCRLYDTVLQDRAKRESFVQQVRDVMQRSVNLRAPRWNDWEVLTCKGPTAVLALVCEYLRDNKHFHMENKLKHVLDLCNSEVEEGGIGSYDRSWGDMDTKQLGRIIHLTEAWLIAPWPESLPYHDVSNLPALPVRYRPMSMAAKILAHHAIPCQEPLLVEVGDFLRVNVDWVVASELSWVGMKGSIAAVDILPQAWRNDRFWLAGDHAVDPRIYSDPKVRELMEGVQQAELDLKMTENQGSNYTILHTEFVRERAQPGMLVLGSDSHTCSAGAVSSLAIGLGAADVMAALMIGETWLRVPESIRVDFVGRPPWYIGGKDVILSILGRLKRNAAAADRVVEFGGPGAAHLSCDARFAICNMCTELGAITGIFESDQIVHQYVAGRKAAVYKSQTTHFAADPEASYSARFTIDLGHLEPYIAIYPDPDNVQPITAQLGMKFDGIFIGACTTTEEDLVLAALVLRAGLSRGLSPAPGTRVVVPGSLPIVKNLEMLDLLEVFSQCGFDQPAPSCSLCLGIGADVAPSGTTWLSTQNRNFKNRMGKGAIGHLCSAAVAAASSFTMTLTDPAELLAALSEETYREYLNRIPSYKRKVTPAVERMHYVEPRPQPSISAMHMITPCESTSVKRSMQTVRSAIYRLGDHIDTDAIIPANACLGNPSDEQLGEHCLEHVEPEFCEGVRKGLEVVVAGKAFGCGSSREEAGRALKGAGVKCVIARSFAYIFARNMPNIGMLAIIIEDDDFFTTAAHGVTIHIDVECKRVSISERSWPFSLGEIELNLLRAGGLGPAIKEYGHGIFGAMGGGAEHQQAQRSHPAVWTGAHSKFAESLDDLSW